MNERLISTLEEIGLSDLHPLFEAQGIDDAVLGDLTDSDLRKTGVEKLGDRKKLLKAFGGGTTTLGEAPSRENLSEAPKATPQDQFTYDARNGKIIITGFNGKGDVVIPEKFDDLPLPVRVIGEKAFCGNGMLTSIILPNGITTIQHGREKWYEDGEDGEWHDGYGAFWDCSSLTSITLPESLTYIGSYAFSGCSSLENITIPQGVTRIGNNAFRYCRNLTSISLPESLTDIGYNAFEGCSGLKSITIPQGVTQIGNNAFEGCTGLNSIPVPAGIEIGDIGSIKGRKWTPRHQPDPIAARHAILILLLLVFFYCAVIAFNCTR